MALLKFIGPHITVAHQRLSDFDNSFKGRKKCLSTGKGFLADLMRLWLGLLGEHVADRFSISNSLFSLIFKTWINVLSCKLKEVFPWPSSDMIIARAPLQSCKYPSTRVVIKCTELFIQQLLSLQSQAITFSHYKHHNIFKALVLHSQPLSSIAQYRRGNGLEDNSTANVHGPWERRQGFEVV